MTTSYSTSHATHEGMADEDFNHKLGFQYELSQDSSGEEFYGSIWSLKSHQILQQKYLSCKGRIWRYVKSSDFMLFSLTIRTRFLRTQTISESSLFSVEIATVQHCFARRFSVFIGHFRCNSQLLKPSIVRPAFPTAWLKLLAAWYKHRHFWQQSNRSNI